MNKCERDTTLIVAVGTLLFVVAVWVLANMADAILRVLPWPE